MTSFTYEWKIVMRHETQGFQKTFHPTAAKLQDALSDADEQLATTGYKPIEFDCIEAKRGRIGQIGDRPAVTNLEKAVEEELLKVTGVLWKDEDEVDGEPVGPIWLRYNDGVKPFSSITEWVTLRRAREIAAEYGVELEQT